MAKKWVLKWRSSAILNFKNVHIWSPDCHQDPNMLYCTRFHRNQMICHWYIMAISRFSRWWISANLNSRGPVMASLKSPCTTSYGSSIETITINCVVFLRKLWFCVRILATDRQTNEQSQCVKHSRCGARRLNSLMPILKPKSNGPLYCSWWVGCYIWYSDEGSGRAGASPQSPPRCIKCNSPPINGQCTNFV